jgi:plastocyanin
MRRSLVPRLACLALAMSGALAGCGGDDDGDVVTIHMKNNKFDPNTVSVKVGQTVRWVNDDDVKHNVMAVPTKGDSGAEFRSDFFGKGGTYETKVDRAGTVSYGCKLHVPMIGFLNVQ